MRHFALLSAALLLTGCSAGMKSDFTCTKIGGLEGCASMTEVRDAMDRGEFSASGHTPTNALPAPDTAFAPLPRRDREGNPQRTEESVQKVTVFPFTTPEGHYVDTTDVYIVLDDSAWTGRPVQAIRKD
ncbi:type IV conjugative transfer system lipoprotein TraV [Pseudomonadota bacterium]